MPFATILKYLPLTDNQKVFFGFSCVLAISYATVASKGARACYVVRLLEGVTLALVHRTGVSYDTMEEKREAMRREQEGQQAAGSAR